MWEVSIKRARILLKKGYQILGTVHLLNGYEVAFVSKKRVRA
jgi:hypothetical protein